MEAWGLPFLILPYKSDHLRQHEHYSGAAWKLEEEARAYVIGGEPFVSHFIAPSAEAIGE